MTKSTIKTNSQNTKTINGKTIDIQIGSLLRMKQIIGMPLFSDGKVMFPWAKVPNCQNLFVITSAVNLRPNMVSVNATVNLRPNMVSVNAADAGDQLATYYFNQARTAYDPSGSNWFLTRLSKNERKQIMNGYQEYIKKYAAAEQPEIPGYCLYNFEMARMLWASWIDTYLLFERIKT